MNPEYLVVTRAKNWTPEARAAEAHVFQLPENKSEIRPNLKCSFCDEVVVMSNGMYRLLRKGRFSPQQVCCLECMMENMQRKN